MKNFKNKLTNNLSDNSQYILYNTSNYKIAIDNSVSEILTKFVEIVTQYIKIISDKIIIKNKQHFRFIFERGIETLIHVFSMIFYYTKNLELTFYHTQKAYFFYIEFIEQISDDNVTFLQLSSRDAILFVYKKTIFDINNEFKKTVQELTEAEKCTLEIVDAYIYIYKSITLCLVNNDCFKHENNNDYIKSIEIISETLNKNKIKPNHVELIYIFIGLLSDKKIDILDVFTILDEFIKRLISKKKFDEKIIKNNIYNLEINNENELNKIVTWIFSD